MIKDDAKIKEQEKQRLNQFLQQLDLKDRRMTEILRTGETLIVQINQLKSEIEKIPINT
jgi:seryl-tRNA(Sec) selenium transferase